MVGAGEKRIMSTPLDFHCGECAASLTDETALFTSCGHFFCDPASVTTASSKCTQLVAGRPGTCEQCGASCNAGVLSKKAKEYDDRVKKFVFGNLETDLRATAEILEVRSLLPACISASCSHRLTVPYVSPDEETFPHSIWPSPTHGLTSVPGETCHYTP
jgi:hypothetical protein